MTNVISFDIETEGVDIENDDITVACIYNPLRKRTFYFRHPDHDRQENIEEFLGELDRAHMLISFNGVYFDIPFIARKFDVEAGRYTAWVCKTFDYFMICKLVFESSCSLNKLLEKNGLSPKSSTGMQAVLWAREGKWDDIAEYCMDDCRLTYEVSMMPSVKLPLRGDPDARVHRCPETGSLSFFRGGERGV